MAPQSECWCHDLDVLTVQDHEAHGVRVAVAGPTLVQTGVLHLDTGQHHLHMVSRHMMSGDHGYLGPAGVGGHQAGHGPVPGLVIMAGDRQRPMVEIPENVIRGLRRGHGAVDSVRGAHIEIHWLLTHNWTFRLCNEKMPKLSQYSRLSNISLVRRPPATHPGPRGASCVLYGAPCWPGTRNVRSLTRGCSEDTRTMVN